MTSFSYFCFFVGVLSVVQHARVRSVSRVNRTGNLIKRENVCLRELISAVLANLLQETRNARDVTKLVTHAMEKTMEVV